MYTPWNAGLTLFRKFLTTAGQWLVIAVRGTTYAMISSGTSPTGRTSFQYKAKPFYPADTLERCTMRVLAQ